MAKREVYTCDRCGTDFDHIQLTLHGAWEGARDYMIIYHLCDLCVDNFKQFLAQRPLR